MARIPKIDLESHFFTPEYTALLESRTTPPRFQLTDENVRVWLEPSLPDVVLTHSHQLRATLLDLSEARIAAMDRAGIAVQFLSVSSPGFEQLEAEIQVEHARKANDVLAAFIAAHPTRFVGLASLPVSAPREAADELERSITELGFKGGNIHSHIGDTYLDDARYFPILERAARLRVPINLHPTLPHANMLTPYLGYGWAMPGPGLGFGHETAVHAMRIIYSGAFDKLPDLEMILGHFGEGLMHWLYRVDFDFNKPWMAKAHRPDIERSRATTSARTSGTRAAGTGWTLHCLPRSTRSASTASCSRATIPGSRSRTEPTSSRRRPSATTTEGRFAMATRSDSSASASRARGESENRSASRVLDVLDLFLEDGSSYTLKEVSERLAIPKSTAHGIVHAMRRHGYLTVDPATNGYTISLHFVGRTRATPAIEVLRQPPGGT